MADGSESRTRILVVDDSKLMRKAALKMLGDEFDIVTADDGLQAWLVLEEDRGIQVVFTDLNMPNSDGYDLLKKVRGSEDGELASLPVIVVTGAENDEAARMSALDLGATDFITKPFTSSDLVARARAHAAHRKETKALQAQSTFDPLTGLANRPGFMQRLQQDLAYARRHHQALSIVRLEIDDFRRMFLNYGREVAESVVRQVAERLHARIRKEDTAARIGLGSFALSLPGGQAVGIAGMISRLRAELIEHAPTDEAGLVIAITLSASVLGATPEMADAEAAFEACDALLQQALQAAMTAPGEVGAIVGVEAHAEIERISNERAEAARIEAERIESERRAVEERADAERRAAARNEAERAAALQVEADRAAAAQAEAARVAAERAAEEQAEAERRAADRAEAARIAAAAEAARVAAARSAAPAAPTQSPAERAAALAALRVDPLLDELAGGNPRPLQEQLPKVIGRLLPLFRLLGPNQRAQLINFLQKLGR
jgi:two-component system cell cycle response regulator